MDETIYVILKVLFDFASVVWLSICRLGDAKDWKHVFCQARNLRYKFVQNCMKSI